MIDICPTVLASDQDSYGNDFKRISNFARRVHIDITDGQFAQPKTVALDQVWWPGNMRADVHVMYAHPFDYIELFVALAAQLVIVHAEAEGDFISFSRTLHKHGIEVGVALLPETSVEVIKPAIDEIDHVLIFSGSLGHYGGEADLNLLQKVATLKALKPRLEIGWDGGVNDQNARGLVRGGVNVLNVGSFIHEAAEAQRAYATLKYVTEAK